MIERETWLHTPAGRYHQRKMRYFHIKWVYGTNKNWEMSFLEVCKSYGVVDILNAEEGYYCHGNGD